MKFNNPSIIDEIKSTSNSDLSPDQKTNRLTEINNYKDSIRSKMKAEFFANKSSGPAYLDEEKQNEEKEKGKSHTIFKYYNDETNLEEHIKEEKLGIHYIAKPFSDLFEEQEILGEGCVGLVKKVTKISDGINYAVKIVKTRDSETIYNIKKEFLNIVKLDHPNIVKVHELYISQFSGKIYLVMELIEANEMFEVIKEIGSYCEEIASKIFKQILSAIKYMHSQGVVHRDLKPNNILSNKDGSQVKITDFNVSKFDENRKKTSRYGFSKEKIKMWTYTGTIAFSAPEILQETEYNESVDMWSAGVVLYTMLCGYQPYNAEYVTDLIDLIVENKLEFSPDPWEQISFSAKDLIQRCLESDPKKRISPTDALMHPWIAHKKASANILPQSFFDNLHNSMKRLTKSKILNPNSALSAKRYTNIITTVLDNQWPDNIDEDISCEPSQNKLEEDEIDTEMGRRAISYGDDLKNNFFLFNKNHKLTLKSVQSGYDFSHLMNTIASNLPENKDSEDIINSLKANLLEKN